MDRKSYSPFVAVDAGPASTVYIPIHRRKWSRALAACGSALSLIVLIGWVLNGSDLTLSSQSLLTSTLDETDDVINKINQGMGGVYYNVFTGKPVHGSSICTSGSYLRTSAEGHRTCVDCPVGQVTGNEIPQLILFATCKMFELFFSGATTTYRLHALPSLLVHTEQIPSHNASAIQV